MLSLHAMLRHGWLRAAYCAVALATAALGVLLTLAVFLIGPLMLVAGVIGAAAAAWPTPARGRSGRIRTAILWAATFAIALGWVAWIVWRVRAL